MSSETDCSTVVLGKRLRQDDMGDSLIRSHMWFEDGNIVLIAENVAFKLHRGVLARQSPIFEDMFSVPQPTVQDQFENCPAVHLHDQASDLEIFIEVLYDGFKFRRSNTWPVLQILLTLGEKYAAEDIRKEALFQLELIFPKTVAEWDARLDNSDKVGAIHTLYEPTLDCIAAVNVARTLDLPTLRAAALYDCCQLGPQVLVMGIDREGARVDRLCAEDLIFCIRAISHMTHVKHYMMNKVGKLASTKKCQTRPACDAGRAAYLSRINDPKDTLYCLQPSVMERADWLEELLETLGVCHSCTKVARRAHHEARRVFLERIHTLAFLQDVG